MKKSTHTYRKTKLKRINVNATQIKLYDQFVYTQYLSRFKALHKYYLLSGRTEVQNELCRKIKINYH